MNNKEISRIGSKILIIRDKQVILDRDIAELYQVETRVLKQAVNRNRKRFPDDFMFILDKEEIDTMVSQNVIPSKKVLGGSSPFAFTEHGIANLSSVLNNDRAIETNIQIMRAFISMRKFIKNNAHVFQRLDVIETKQIEHDNKIKQLFEIIDQKELQPTKGIFFEGEVFDAHVFVSRLIRDAKKEIILIDNYIDENVLALLTKRKSNVQVKIYTKNSTEALSLDIKKHNEQYPTLSIETFHRSHDRFLIIDAKTVYHFGASLKDLGKKWFAFSRFDTEAIELLKRVQS